MNNRMQSLEELLLSQDKIYIKNEQQYCSKCNYLWDECFNECYIGDVKLKLPKCMEPKNEESKDEIIDEELKACSKDYIYIKDGELYCTKCGFIGMYICDNECCICEAKWLEEIEPKNEQHFNDLLPPLNPAPLVMQLSIPHVLDTTTLESRIYNKQLDDLLKEKNRLSSTVNS
jgi:hypothetical protein